MAEFFCPICGERSDRPGVCLGPASLVDAHVAELILNEAGEHTKGARGG